MAETSTSILSMIKLFEAIFKNGHMKMYPRLNENRFQWTLWALLHRSYDFAVEKPTRIPEWVKNAGRLFMSFLAGYTDGEGCLSISRANCRYILRTIVITTQDVDILKDIKEKLAEYGYNPILYLVCKKGTLNHFGPCNKDMWQLCIQRKDEVLKCLQELPIQHNDKIRMKRLMLDTKDATHWSEVEGMVMALRKQISDGKGRCRLEAEKEYKKHRGAVPHVPERGHL